MPDIEFVRLNTIPKECFLNLMNNEKVRRYLPLLEGTFSQQDYNKFLKSKQKLWDEFGFGPWAIKIHGKFAGWGGLQPEGGNADFALVLDPKFWGWGFKIFSAVKKHAYSNLPLKTITVLLPPSRVRLKFLFRLNFIEDGEVVINGKVFSRFRLAETDQ